MTGINRRELLAATGLGLAASCAGSTRRGTSQSMRDVLVPPVERGDVPGLVALVARGNRHEMHALGVRTAGTTDAVLPDSIFRISSMTKPIAAAAVMLLVDDGKLQLDEPVDRLLPELANRTVLRRLDGPLDDVVPAARAITVRDVLTFRMGFGMVLSAEPTPIQAASTELLGDGMPAPEKLPAMDEWLRRLSTLPLMHQPGERWMYNTSAIVFGALVARASGQAFDAFLRERLFGPLGMVDTDFSVPPEKQARFGALYLVDGDKLALYDAVDGQWSRPPALCSGADGLVSTAPDLLRFSSLLLGNGTIGGKRLLSPESVTAMTTDALTPENKAFGAFDDTYFKTHGWGFGMAVVTHTDELGMPPGSYGWDGGLGSSWYADPRTHTTGILLTNRAWVSPSPPPLFSDFWRTVNA